LVIASTQLTTLAAAAADTVKEQPVNSDNGTERVRTLFRDGNARLLAGDYESARTTLLQAWALRQSSDIAGALGQVEIATRRYRDAAEHLEWCLAHFPPVESEKVLLATRQLFEQAKQAVAQVRVSVNRDGAAILIDGKPVGKTPIPAPLFVDPGQHRVEARLDEVGDSRNLVVEAGKVYGIDFALVPAARDMTPGVDTESQNVRTASASSGRSILPVIVGGAVFAVALGAGVALLDSSGASYDVASSLQNQVGPTGCGTPTSNQSLCADLRRTIEKGDRRERWGAVALATAGLALVAVPVYWFWPREREANNADRAQWRFRGSVAPLYSGLSLAGEF
jgi:hypothetical protein